MHIVAAVVVVKHPLTIAVVFANPVPKPKFVPAIETPEQPHCEPTLWFDVVATIPCIWPDTYPGSPNVYIYMQQYLLDNFAQRLS